MKGLLATGVLLVLAHQFSTADWVPSNNGLTNHSVGALYADADTLYAGTTSSTFGTTDLGDTWTAGGGGLPGFTNFYALVRSGDALVAGGDSPGIWRSTDNGLNWSQITAGVDADEAVLSFLADGNTVYAAIGYSSAFGVSTDNGQTWTKYTSGLTSGQTMTGVAKIGSTLFLCHQTLGVYTSADGGMNWTLTSAIGAQSKNALISTGNTLLVAVNDGIYRSVNGGTTWNRVLNGTLITGLSVHGSEVFAVGQSEYVSYDEGATWNLIDDNGLPGTVFSTMQFAGDYAFVNTYGAGVYRRPLSEISSVSGAGPQAPDAFRLYQNYPNPFNPSTTISFSVTRASFVTLTVSDLLGRRIATLLSGQVAPGDYTLTWDASGQPSGTYYYTLEAEEGDRVEYTGTRKLLLLR